MPLPPGTIPTNLPDPSPPGTGVIPSPGPVPAFWNDRVRVLNLVAAIADTGDYKAAAALWIEYLSLSS